MARQRKSKMIEKSSGFLLNKRFMIWTNSYNNKFYKKQDEFSYEVAELFEGLGNYISEDNESIKDDEEHEDRVHQQIRNYLKNSKETLSFNEIEFKIEDDKISTDNEEYFNYGQITINNFNGIINFSSNMIFIRDREKHTPTKYYILERKNKEDKYQEIDGFIVDENNNKVSLKITDKETAIKMLDSLTNCTDCLNCFNCSNCDGCEDSDNCIDCKICKFCSECNNCMMCNDCNNCDNCQMSNDCNEVTDGNFLNPPKPIQLG